MQTSTWPQCGQNQSFVRQYSNSQVTREDHNDGTRGQMSGRPSTNSSQYKPILPALPQTQDGQWLPQSEPVTRHCIGKTSNQQASNIHGNPPQQAHSETPVSKVQCLLMTMLQGNVVSQTTCDTTPSGNHYTLPGRVDSAAQPSFQQGQGPSLLNHDKNINTFIHKVAQHKACVRQERACHGRSAPPAMGNSPNHVNIQKTVASLQDSSRMVFQAPQAFSPMSKSSHSFQIAQATSSGPSTAPSMSLTTQLMCLPNNQRDSSGSEINRIQHGVSLNSGPPNPPNQHPSQPFNNHVIIVNAADGLSLPYMSQQSQYNGMDNFLSGYSQTHQNGSVYLAGHHYSQQPNRPNPIPRDKNRGHSEASCNNAHLTPTTHLVPGNHNANHPHVTYSRLPGPLPNEVGFGNALLSSTRSQTAHSSGAGGQALQQHFTHQVPASTPEHYISHNGPAVSTSNHGRQSSSLQNPQGPPPPYPRRQCYYMMVTEDKSEHGFRADNVIFMGNKPSESTLAIHGHLKGPSASQVPPQDHNKINYNQLNGTIFQQKSSVQSSAVLVSSVQFIKPSESHNHKPSVVGQKAIAVVQPQVSRTINMFDKLPSVTQSVTTTTDCVVSKPGKHSCNQRPQAREDNIQATYLPIESGQEDPKIRLEQSLPTDFNTEKVDSQLLSNVECHPSLTPHRKEINDTEINTQCPVNQSKEEISENEREVVSVEDIFESSISVINWTTDRLMKLIDQISKHEDNSETNVSKDIVSLFWDGSCQKLLEAMRCLKELDQEVRDFFRKHNTSPETVIFAQIKDCDQVSDKCQVLKHYVFPKVVHKSSWLNTNNELDDIDKEFGFPLSLRYGLQTLQREEQPKLIGTEKEKSALSSSEKQNEVKTQAKMATPESVDNEQIQGISATQTASPVQRKHADVKSSYPFSSLEIRILPPEEAKRIFDADLMQGKEREDRQTEVTSEYLKNDTLKDDLPEEMDVKSVEMTSENKVNDYCCLLQWREAVNGSGCSLPCKCRCTIELRETVVNTVDSGEATVAREQWATKASQRESLHFAISNGNLSDTVEGKRVEYSGNDVNPLSLKSIRAEQCSEMISISDDTNEIIHSSTGKETESLLLPRPSSMGLTITHQNIVEVEIAEVFSSYEDVLKMATTISEPIIDSRLHKLPSKRLPRPQKPVNQAQNLKVSFEKLNAIGFEAFPSVRSSDLLPPNSFLESLSLRQKFHKYLSPKKSSCCKNEKKGLKRKRNLSIESPFLKKQMKKANVPALEANLTKDCIKSFVDEYNTDEPHKSGTSKWLEEKQPDATDLKKETETGYGTSSCKFSTVCLALFGSSPQRKNGTVATGQHRDFRSSRAKAFSDTSRMPPPTLSVNVTSRRRDPLDTSLDVKVKQRILRDWKKSFVPTKTKSRGKTSKISNRRGFNQNVVIEEAPTKTPTPTNTDVWVLSSEGGAVEDGTGQTKQPLGHVEKESILNGLKLRMKRSKMGVVPSTKLEAVEKSKYEIGNPALMFLQKSNVLRFNVLPESFSFKDEQETMDLETSTKEMTGSELPASVVTKTFVKGVWSVDTGNTFSPFISSNFKVAKSTTTFQEYQKKYKDKT